MLRQKSERLENAAAERAVGIGDALLDGNQVLCENQITHKIKPAISLRPHIVISNGARNEFPF
jgi:hypothetical protein